MINNKVSQGAALLIFMLIMITVIATMLLTAVNARYTTSMGRDTKVLQQAKEALISYALLFSEQNPGRAPGFMPCPDQNGDGLADAPCGLANTSVIGRLPWRTLNLPVLRDHSGACLWYAVSGGFKQAPTNDLILNADGQFLVVNEQLTAITNTPAFAVVFAPGEAFPNQARTANPATATQCGSTIAGDAINNPANFMDTLATLNNATGLYGGGNLAGNAVTGLATTGLSAVMSAAPRTDFNDQVAVITEVDFSRVFRYLQRWIGNKTRLCLSTYAATNATKLPWPASLNPLAAPDYADNAGSLRFGRIPSSLTNSAASGLSPLWGNDPDEPLTRCFSWAWWPSVRENIFYGIDSQISPVSLGNQGNSNNNGNSGNQGNSNNGNSGNQGNPCNQWNQGNPCNPGNQGGSIELTVNGALESAVILISSRKTAAQNRTSHADKGALINYLNPMNQVDAGVGALPPGNDDFIGQPSLNELTCTLALCP